jgi:NAD(P)-dependent dehydrogenase (short-subunit alcohol dehydrogenase family)
VTTVLITGAAGDIGTAIAEVLAQRGYELALAEHPSGGARLAETVDACRQLGANVKGVTFDVTEEAAVVELAPLGGVVNNAGYQASSRRWMPTRSTTRAASSRSTCSG